MIFCFFGSSRLKRGLTEIDSLILPDLKYSTWEPFLVIFVPKDLLFFKILNVKGPLCTSEVYYNISLAGFTDGNTIFAKPFIVALTSASSPLELIFLTTPFGSIYPI